MPPRPERILTHKIKQKLACFQRSPVNNHSNHITYRHLYRGGVTGEEIAQPVFRHLGRGSASLPRAYRQLNRLRLLARRTQGNTKAEVVAARRPVPDAVRRPTKPGGAAPTAATAHAGRAKCRASRIPYGLTRIVAIPVLTPLPHIAMHIVNAPCIRFFAADGMCCISRVSTEPSVID